MQDLPTSAFGDDLDDFGIEIPSWGLGRAGTRFETYTSDSEPDTVEERIEAAGEVYEYTGHGKTVSLHFPWDGSTREDVEDVRALLEDEGLQAGAVNANLFTMRENSTLDDRLRYGSLISPYPDVRDAVREHIYECIDWMRLLDSDTLILWLPDGTNSFGQLSFFDMYDRVADQLDEIEDELRDEEEVLVEYKPFEPAFYATAIFDWGSALSFSEAAGESASVLVDTGHHLQGANVEQIVGYLSKLDELGGFHFNDSKYADDDLVTGSLDPAEVFRIFTTLREADSRGLLDMHDVSYMIDQAHYVRDPTDAMIESVENVQLAYLRSGLVDFEELHSYQQDADIKGAEAEIYSAMRTDARPALKEWREENDIPTDWRDARSE